MRRLFDIIIAIVLLFLLAPIMAVITLAVRLVLGTPVLFRQTRPGLHGQSFTTMKLRTMRDAHDAGRGPLADEERLTLLGQWLRTTGLHELPELWNVLRGNMSLVGPRPLLMRYLPLYTPEQLRRHDVRPGITGWAQTSGRNALNWHEKVALDLWYVDNHSLLVDLKILWRTAASVLKRHGISNPESATMPEFTGTPPPSDAVPVELPQGVNVSKEDG